MARASDDSAEVMRFGSVSGNVAGNDEHGSEYTVDFGLSEGDDFQGFESGAWVFNARNIPEGTYSVLYTITDEEGVGGAALQIKVEGTPPGFPTDGGGSGDDSGGDGGAGGDGDSDGGGDGNGPPSQPRSFNAVELTLLSMDVHRAGEDGTDGNAEWSLDVRVVPPPVSAFGTPQFLLDENRFQFRERAVDDGDRFIFDQRDDNTFFLMPYLPIPLRFWLPARRTMEVYSTPLACLTLTIPCQV
jgi:hypothetical protein